MSQRWVFHPHKPPAFVRTDRLQPSVRSHLWESHVLCALWQQKSVLPTDLAQSCTISSHLYLWPVRKGKLIHNVATRALFSMKAPHPEIPTCKYCFYRVSTQTHA